MILLFPGIPFASCTFRIINKTLGMLNGFTRKLMTLSFFQTRQAKQVDGFYSLKYDWIFSHLIQPISLKRGVQTKVQEKIEVTSSMFILNFPRFLWHNIYLLYFLQLQIGDSLSLAVNIFLPLCCTSYVAVFLKNFQCGDQ